MELILAEGDEGLYLPDIYSQYLLKGKYHCMCNLFSLNSTALLS